MGLRLVGEETSGGGGGAPTGAPYVTTAADPDLTAEKVLGTDVIMSGTLAARPAFGTAGRLYFATDDDGGTLARDTGSAWVNLAAGLTEVLADAVIPAGITRDSEHGGFTPTGHHTAFVQADHDALPNPHHADHAAVTLDPDADLLLGLTGQALSLDTQAANLVLAGPPSGPVADPTFRALVDADIPAAIMRDSEHVADAPVGASYVTTAAEAGLTGEKVLGTDVIMAGTLAARPAFGTAGRLYFATDDAGGTLYRDSGSAWVTVAELGVSLNFIIDGAGAVITTGQKGHVEVPFAITITGWTILADQSGSIVVDVWKDSYANFPPTVADTIAGTEKPTLASVQKNQDLSLTTWTTSVAAGDILAFNVDSVTTVQRVVVSLRGVRA